MKTKLIAFCVSSVLIGTGIVFNMNQDVSVPTVEKFMEDTSLSVSKHEAIVSEHENVGKDEKTGAGDTMKKPESKEEKQKKKLRAKVNSKQQVFLRKVKGKILRKKVLLRVFLVQTKNLQLQTVPIHQINQKKML
ncbi:hypothetical protein ACTQXP_06540 [Holdemanella porci]|uniref:hypothetical protein n=1 Tax=Holdemanella porci TaxID=2652276 RepID=UPI003F91B423